MKRLVVSVAWKVLLLPVLIGAWVRAETTHDLRIMRDGSGDPVELRHIVTTDGDEQVVSQMPFTVPDGHSLDSSPTFDVDASGAIHIAYAMLDLRNESAYIGTLYYATDTGGQLVSEQVATHTISSGDTHYWNARIRIPPSTDRPLIVFQYVENGLGGSWILSHLKSFERRADGSWYERVIADSDDGYRGTDGPRYTGVQMTFEMTPQGEPVVVFADLAAYHVGHYANYFEGQIRLARWHSGEWAVSKLLNQTALSSVDENSAMEQVRNLRFTTDEYGNRTVEAEMVVAAAWNGEVVEELGPFTYPVVSPPAPAPVCVSPSGEVTDPRPTLVWSGSPGASWYNLYLLRNGEAYFERWLQDTEFPVFWDLPSGNYQWGVIGWNTAGFSDWSDPMLFTVPVPTPEAPTPITPTGEINDLSPGFEWQAVDAAQWYHLYIAKDGAHYYDTWLQATEFQPWWPLAGGSYEWWISAWNPDWANEEWSAGSAFTVTPVKPGAATLIAPSGTVSTARPAFQWEKTPHAAWYQVYIIHNSQYYYDTWTQQTEFAPDWAMGDGNYVWYVRTWGPGGFGDWSDPMDFTVQP